MKHDWFIKYNGALSLVANKKRTCRNCGAVQAFEDIHYDRISGLIQAWRPLVGRCKGKLKQENNAFTQ